MVFFKCIFGASKAKKAAKATGVESKPLEAASASLSLTEMAKAVGAVAGATARYVGQEHRETLEKVFDEEMEQEVYKRCKALSIVVSVRSVLKNAVLQCDGLSELPSELNELSAVMEDSMAEVIALVEEHFAAVARAILAGKSVQHLLPSNVSTVEGVSDLALFAMVTLRAIENTCTMAAFEDCQPASEEFRAALRMRRDLKLKLGTAVSTLAGFLEQLLIIITVAQE